MFQTIERLRAKPDRTKKQVAFLTAFFVTGIIFVVWVSVVYPDFKARQDAAKKVSAKDPTPTSGLAEIFSTGIGAIGEQFSQIKEAISEGASNDAYYASPVTGEVKSEIKTVPEGEMELLKGN